MGKPRIASLNSAFFGLSVSSAVFSSLLLLFSLATNHWEYHGFNEECVISKNNSNSPIEINGDYFTITMMSNTTTSITVNEVGVENTVYRLHDRYAGVWRLCNVLSELSQKFIYGNSNRCFDYIAEYPVIKDRLSPDTIMTIQMRNSAISSLILDILMIIAAGVTAVIGFMTNQIICLMVTGVLFILTAFYTGMALIVMHVKMFKEVETCSGITKIPALICDCLDVYADWSLYVAWVAVFMCIVTFFLWIHLTKLLRQTATKLTL